MAAPWTADSSKGLDGTPLDEMLWRDASVATKCGYVTVRTGSPFKKLINTVSRMTPNVDYKTRRDQVVARRLQNTFERDLELASVQGLNFFVQDGVVTLYGTIRHELDRELISNVVRSVPGVREVVEHVSLARPDQGPHQPE